MQQRSDLKLEQLKGVNMIRMKNIAAILALIGSFGAAHASTNLQKDNIQFMEDKNLAEIQGASMIDDLIDAANKVAERGKRRSEYEHKQKERRNGQK